MAEASDPASEPAVEVEPSSAEPGVESGFERRRRRSQLGGGGGGGGWNGVDGVGARCSTSARPRWVLSAAQQEKEDRKLAMALRQEEEHMRYLAQQKRQLQKTAGGAKPPSELQPPSEGKPSQSSSSSAAAAAAAAAVAVASVEAAVAAAAAGGARANGRCSGYNLFSADRIRLLRETASAPRDSLGRPLWFGETGKLWSSLSPAAKAEWNGLAAQLRSAANEQRVANEAGGQAAGGAASNAAVSRATWVQCDDWCAHRPNPKPSHARASPLPLPRHLPSAFLSCGLVSSHSHRSVRFHSSQREVASPRRRFSGRTARIVDVRAAPRQLQAGIRPPAADHVRCTGGGCGRRRRGGGGGGG